MLYIIYIYVKKQEISILKKIMFCVYINILC